MVNKLILAMFHVVDSISWLNYEHMVYRVRPFFLEARQHGNESVHIDTQHAWTTGQTIPTSLPVNPSNAEPTFVPSTGMQRFSKTIQTLL